MPIFRVSNNKTKRIEKSSFSNEKELQNFVEKNLEELFDIRFLATEFSTSAEHGGRIDTLGLDENNAPVIIEYKWGENSAIINQGLFYLDWLVDHQANFQLLVQSKLKAEQKIDFKSPRVLLIAASFSRYDIYAIKRMAENIELWSYVKYENDLVEFKIEASSSPTQLTGKTKHSKVEYKNITVDEYLKGRPKELVEIVQIIREKISDLDSSDQIAEKAFKNGLAYKANQNFIYIHVRNRVKTVRVHVKWPESEYKKLQAEINNSRLLYRYYRGFAEFVLKDINDIDKVMPYLKQAFQRET